MVEIAYKAIISPSVFYLLYTVLCFKLLLPIIIQKVFYYDRKVYIQLIPTAPTVQHTTYTGLTIELLESSYYLFLSLLVRDKVEDRKLCYHSKKELYNQYNIVHVRIFNVLVPLLMRRNCPFIFYVGTYFTCSVIDESCFLCSGPQKLKKPLPGFAY